MAHGIKKSDIAEEVKKLEGNPCERITCRCSEPSYCDGWKTCADRGLPLVEWCRPCFTSAVLSAERERVRNWIGSDESIQVALRRKRLTDEAVGIAGMPKPDPENAMGAVLVAVGNFLKPNGGSQ